MEAVRSSTLSPGALFALGYQGLISITPPGAQLAPGSKLNAASLGKAPGRKLVSGQWAGYNWRNHPTTADDVARWETDGANVGLRADHYPGLDIDALDEDVAAIVEDVAKDVLGPAPVRTGRAPKRLLMYKLADAQISRMRLHLEKKTGTSSSSHLVELLGAGQQYLVYGTHPVTNAPYTWDKGGPPAAAELTPITREQVETLFDRLVVEFTALGWKAQREGDGYARSESTVDQAALHAPSLDALGALVAKIPNDDQHYPGRDDYVRLGYAVRAAAGEQIEEGFDVFAEWAARHVKDGRVSGNPGTWREDYGRMRPPFSVGWGWLQDEARGAGHSDAPQVFDVVTDAPPVNAPAVLTASKTRALDIGDSLEGLLRDPSLLEPPVPAIPFLAWPGFRTILSATEKTGKSTLAFAGVAAASNGTDFLGEPTMPQRTVWVGEEPKKLWVQRAVRMRANPKNVHYVRIGFDPPAQLAGAVLAFRPTVVVLDTLYRYADIEDENRASLWRPIFGHFDAVIGEKLALLMLVHARRASADGKYRGSGAVGGYVEQILEMADAAPESDVRYIGARGRVELEKFAVRFDKATATFKLLTDHGRAQAHAEKIRAFFAERRKNPKLGRLMIETIRNSIGGSLADALTALKYLRELGEFNANAHGAWGPVDGPDEFTPVEGGSK